MHGPIILETDYQTDSLLEYTFLSPIDNSTVYKSRQTVELSI